MKRHIDHRIWPRALLGSVLVVRLCQGRWDRAQQGHAGRTGGREGHRTLPAEPTGWQWQVWDGDSPTELPWISSLQNRVTPLLVPVPWAHRHVAILISAVSSSGIIAPQMRSCITARVCSHVCKDCAFCSVNGPQAGCILSSWKRTGHHRWKEGESFSATSRPLQTPWPSSAGRPDVPWTCTTSWQHSGAGGQGSLVEGAAINEHDEGGNAYLGTEMQARRAGLLLLFLLGIFFC